MSSQRKQQRAHRAEVQRVRAEMLGVINALRAKYNCAVHDLKNLTQ